MFGSRIAVWLAAVSAASLPGASTAADGPTFHRDVERILRKHCQECHRPGQVAPFSLLTYEQAKKRAGDLVAVCEDRLMPPWHASTTEGGPFKDARVLTSAEIATLAAWAESGAPKGDQKDAPAPPNFESDWPLGKPDLILTPKEAYRLGATGPDEFRVFVLPTGLTEAKWIAAVDYKPGNRKVVHHILGAYDSTGRARKMDEADPGPGYKTFAAFGTDPDGLPFRPTGGLSGWAPGKSPNRLPAGVGRFLPAGSDVLLQIHYHKSGKEEDDATSIGLYFADKPVDKQVRGGFVFPPRPGPLQRPKLLIPAGDSKHEVKGSFVVPYDAHLQAVVPHMHLIGKDFALYAIRDGERETLIKVDRWDFNWQDTYEFAKPVALPKGTRLEMVAHFDNSASNPSNPSKPPIDMTWGEQTTNEMCIAFLQVTDDAEHLDGKHPARPATPMNFDPRAIFPRAAGIGRGKTE